MELKAAQINEETKWQDLTEGLKIFEPATSRLFETGEWRTQTPVWEQRLRNLRKSMPFRGDFDEGGKIDGNQNQYVRKRSDCICGAPD